MRQASGSALVSATAFRLLKAYAPARFVPAARELDRVAASLARDARGRVIARETTTVAGRRIRAYRFLSHPASGATVANRIGFVLVGMTEVQLLCQAPADGRDPDPGGACALLFDSFSLEGGS